MQLIANRLAAPTALLYNTRLAAARLDADPQEHEAALEWSIAVISKNRDRHLRFASARQVRRGGRVVECGGLENR